MKGIAAGLVSDWGRDSFAKIVLNPEPLERQQDLNNDRESEKHSSALERIG